MKRAASLVSSCHLGTNSYLESVHLPNARIGRFGVSPVMQNVRVIGDVPSPFAGKEPNYKHLCLNQGISTRVSFDQS